MRAFRKFVWLALPAMATAFVAPSSVRAETIESALARAYEGNPQLNAQRASVRATDEYIPQALSGYRPRIGATATVGGQRADLTDVNDYSQWQCLYPARHHGDALYVWSYGNAKCVQRVSDGQQNSHRRKPSHGGERGSARTGTNHSSQWRDELHGRAARHRNRTNPTG